MKNLFYTVQLNFIACSFTFTVRSNIEYHIAPSHCIRWHDSVVILTLMFTPDILVAVGPQYLVLGNPGLLWP